MLRAGFAPKLPLAAFSILTPTETKTNMKSLCIPLVGLLVILLVSAAAAQSGPQKLTLGYSPVSGAALPLFIAIKERLFHKLAGTDLIAIASPQSALTIDGWRQA
jgi:ABC-type nitrate/sulfonate/bicarbonate transport system substrate-binding protein